MSETAAAPDIMPVIMRIQQVSKCYEGGPAVVQDLNLDLREGEFLTLLGPSGCGKSTTLRMMAGLEKPDRGHILLHGRDITDDPPHRRPINTVFQDYALFPHLSVRNNIGFGLRTQRMANPEIRRRVDAMLELVGLSARSQDRPSDLSGGQKQRVAIARALVKDPKILILDDATSSVDAETEKSIQEALRGTLRESSGRTTFIVAHRLSTILLADRIIVLEGGRVAEAGTHEKLLQRRGRYHALYGGERREERMPA